MVKSRTTSRLWFLVLVVLATAVLVSYLALAVRPQPVGAIPALQTLPTIGYSNAFFTAAENIGTAQIDVQISAIPETGKDVVVEYFTLDGSAVEGDDYVRATGTITFTSSSSSNVQSFNVTIIDNNTVNESDKTVNLVLNLKTPATAVLGRSTATLIITDEDFATSTPPPSAGTGTPIFVDPLEPNNTFGEASTIGAGAAKTCSLTLWPPGDLDYYNFATKSGTFYKVLTSDLSPGLDTVLKIYDPSGNPIAENDDVGGIGDLSSQVIFQAQQNGNFFARVVNKSPTDPANLTYCFQIIAMSQPTATPTATVVPTRTGSDACEPNGHLDLACLFGDNQSQEFNFVPPYNAGPDNDYYKLWVRAGGTYTCETTNLSNVADTNIIFLDANGNDFNPQLGNDNKAPGDLGSKLTYFATYTGYLHILVGPVNPVPVEDAARFTYTLACVVTIAPTAAPTFAPLPPSGGGSVPPTAQATFTPFPTPTPFDLGALLTPSPVVIPVVTVQPLPTATPVQGGQDVSTVNVVVYYDSNFNFTAEPTEGIVDVAVALYDNNSSRLIAFGYTNEDGTVRFESIASTGTIRVEVPLLSYTQIVGGGESSIAVRVAPLPLPIGIP